MSSLSGENEVRIRLTFAEPLDRVTATLLVVFTTVYLLQELVPPLNRFALTYLALDTATFLARFYLWQAVTAIFLHGSVCHFGGNMVFFWFFGSALSNGWKHRDFLVYFFICGIGASLCFYFFNVLRVPPGGPGIKGLGASGAVFGLMVAYAIVYGDRIILAFFMIPMKAKHFIGICIAIELLIVYKGVQDGIGHVTHLAGAVIGALYLKLVWRQQKGLAGVSRQRAATGSRMGGLEVMDDGHE